MYVGAFNQEKTQVGAFSVILKTDCETDGSSAALLLTLSCTPLRDSGPSLDLIVGAMREGDTRTLPQPCRRWFKYTSSRILSQRSSSQWAPSARIHCTSPTSHPAPMQIQEEDQSYAGCYISADSFNTWIRILPFVFFVSCKTHYSQNSEFSEK